MPNVTRRPSRLPDPPPPRWSRVGWARVALAIAVTVLAAGCGSAAVTATPSPATTAAGPRPSSPATVEIVSPAAGAKISGASVHVVLRLTGARIVAATTTTIRPDEGHIHLYVDNVLVSMNYGLEQDIAVHPGTWVLKAEFVASDHAPFSPRVWSPEVYFTVQ
jgi:hypothetical protein